MVTALVAIAVVIQVYSLVLLYRTINHTPTKKDSQEVTHVE